MQDWGSAQSASLTLQPAQHRSGIKLEGRDSFLCPAMLLQLCGAHAVRVHMRSGLRRLRSHNSWQGPFAWTTAGISNVQLSFGHLGLLDTSNPLRVHVFDELMRELEGVCERSRVWVWRRLTRDYRYSQSTPRSEMTQ